MKVIENLLKLLIGVFSFTALTALLFLGPDLKLFWISVAGMWMCVLLYHFLKRL